MSFLSRTFSRQSVQSSLRRSVGISLMSLLAGIALVPQQATAQFGNQAGNSTSRFCQNQTVNADTVVQGRSYGDPHINTFDGFHYGFQTVGEFILAHSGDRAFEVQTRQAQVPNRANLSLNTAVALRVCDQRVGIYVQDSPDGRSAVWVDGQPVQVDEALALDNGGEIQRLGDRNYTVIWPSGDQVVIKEITVSGMRFLNIMPIISAEHRNDMFGLLGNFNGNPDDDLIGRDGSTMPARSTYSVASNALNQVLPAAIPVNEIGTAYFEQLNQQFGDSWRVNQPESLFDYPAGMTTADFTNRNFPEQFLTLNGVSDEDLEAAIAECEAAGVEEELMDGCVFDVAATGNTSFTNAAVGAVTNVVVERVTNRVIDEIERAIPIPGGFGFPF